MKQSVKILIKFFCTLNIVAGQLYGATIGSDLSVKRVDTQQILANGDKVAGFTSLAGGFKLENPEATATFDALLPVSGEMDLNGGTLVLNRDLKTNNVSSIKNLGNIIGKNFMWEWNPSIAKIPTAADFLGATFTFDTLKLSLKSDVVLCNSVKFSNNSVLNGQGSILDLSSGGTLIIGSGSTLTLSNIMIKGIEAGSFVFEGNTSRLQLGNNVTFELSSNVTMTQGSVLVFGPSTWIIKDKTWTFGGTSALTVDGVTLWKDQAGAVNSGTIAFGSPQTNFLTLTAGGAIKNSSASLATSIDCDTYRSITRSISDSSGCDCCYISYLRHLHEDGTNLAPAGIVGDWSHDDAFIGTLYKDTISNDFIFDIRDGETLSTLDSFALSSPQVKALGLEWLPSNHVVGLCKADNNTESYHLTTYSITVTGGIVPVSSREMNSDVSTLDFTPQGDYVAIGQQQSSSSDIAIYSVTSGGVLSASPVVTTSLAGTNVVVKKVKWDATGNYLAVGLAEKNNQNALRIFTFNPTPTPALTLSAQANVAPELSKINYQPISTLAWHPTSQNVLAVGLGPDSNLFSSNPTVSGELVQLFEFNSDPTPILIYKIGIPELSKSVWGLDWSPEGNCLAVGKRNGTGPEVLTYAFNNDPYLLVKKSVEEFTEDGIREIRYSNAGDRLFVATLEQFNIGLYETSCFEGGGCDFQSRLDSLESCCEVVDSRITYIEENCCDDCCVDLTSRVEVLESCCDVVDSRVEVLESCCEVVDSRVTYLEESCCDECDCVDLTSRVEVLESCCDVVDSRVDVLESCCETVDSRVSYIEENCCDDCCIDLTSRVEVLETCCEEVGSRVEVLESFCETVDSRVTYIEESCCDECDCQDLTSRVEVLESCCDVVDSRVDSLESCCEVVDSRITYIEENCCNECDCQDLTSRVEVLETCCDEVGSRVEVLESCCETVDSRVSYIEENCCDDCCIDLTSRVEVLETCCDEVGSRVDVLESCCEVVDSRITYIEENCCNECDCQDLTSRVEVLESCCDVVDSRVDVLESCCEVVDSRITYLEESCCDECDCQDLTSRVEVLESCCDVVDSRVESLESCCEEVGSRVDVLETCCSEVDSRLDILESCCETVDSRVTYIEESCCDECDCQDLTSRVEVLESCCDVVDSRVESLESCCEEVGSRVDVLETCCSEVDSRLDILESCCETVDSRVTYIEESCCDECDCQDLTSRIEVLETCCSEVDSRLDTLESCCETVDSRITYIEESCCDECACQDLLSRVEVLETCCDVVDSRVDVLESCCEVVDSRITYLEESCCDECDCQDLTSRVEVLESCCDVVDSRVDVLESCCEVVDSRITYLEESCCDECDCADLTSRIEVLETCCTEVDSRLDVMESCCETVDSRLTYIEDSCCDACDCADLTSRIEVLETCCTEVDSRLDIMESCCETVDSRLTYIEDSCCDACDCADLTSRVEVLETCCTEVDSRLDIMESCCETVDSRLTYIEDSCCDACDCADLTSRIEVLETCCTEVDSRLDIMESCCETVDSRLTYIEDSCCDACDCADLTSRIEVLETCCTEVDSRLDVMESCCETVDSRLTFVEDSCCDECDCESILSRLDALESCCEEVQSKIDECCTKDCCQVYYVKDAGFTNFVETVDWSYDDGLIAVGFNNDSTDDKTFKILNGSTLATLDEHLFTYTLGISTVRWHPSKRLVVVGRVDYNSINVGGEDQLHIFAVDAAGNITSEVSSNEHGTNVFAVAWHPSGNYLAIARYVGNNEIAMYAVDGSGHLSNHAIVTQNLPGTVAIEALTWDPSGQYLAVGVENTGSNNTLDIYQFNSGVPSLALNAAIQVPSSGTDYQSVRALAWNPQVAGTLAVGIGVKTGDANIDISGNLLQIYTHDSGAGTLTKMGGVSGLTKTVIDTHWSPDGQCLAIGKYASDDAEFRTYLFDSTTYALTQKTADNTFGNNAVPTVRYSHDGRYIINGSENTLVTLYRNEVCCDDICSRIDALQSQIDACSCNDLTSRLDILESCCTEVDSRLDIMESCCETVDSRVEVLETCCADVDSRVDILETCCADVDSRLDILESCCENVDSRLDIMESCCETVDSRVEVLETCCADVDSRVDILETCCADVDSRLDILESCCENVDSRLDIMESCCETVDSRVEVLETCCADVDSRLDILESCCDTVDSRVSYIEENCCDDCCIDLTSRVEVLETCCEEVGSRVEVLESCCETVDSRVSYIEENCCDDCCIDLTSRIEVLESCCEDVQSKIDACGCDSCWSCCSIELLESAAFDHPVLTLDWSHDDRCIAIGLDNYTPLKVSNGIVADLNEIKLLDARTLDVQDTYTFSSCMHEISQLRWHPSKHIFAVGRAYRCEGQACECDEECVCTHLQTFSVDCETRKIYLIDTESNENKDVHALAWHPSGNWLAVGRHGSEIAIYTVDANGDATESFSIAAGGEIQSLDWNESGEYLAVGIENTDTDSLEVYKFTAPTTLVLNAATPVKLDPENEYADGQTVRSVSWNKQYPNLIAVGIGVPRCSSDENITGELIQVFEHDGAGNLRSTDGTLTYKTGVTDINKAMRSVHWNPQFPCLASGKATGSGETLQTYEFIYDPMSLTYRDAYGSSTFTDVRYSPNGNYLAGGTIGKHVYLFRNCCLSGWINDLRSRIDECCLSQFDGCCQSLLDECCGDLHSRVEVLESCCETVDSRVEHLETCCEDVDSRLDIMESCCETVDSRLEIMESCCEEVRSSTGFLQSQIDTLSDCCEECVITVSGDTYFTLDMLPGEGEVVIFKFNECFAPCCSPCFDQCDETEFATSNHIPRLLFDPAVYGNDGIVELPKYSRTVFDGTGIVELMDGTRFVPLGTPSFDSTLREDWPCLVTQNGATMHLAHSATAMFGGIDTMEEGAAGKFILRQEGMLCLDQASHFIFGGMGDYTQTGRIDDLEIRSEFNSNITVRNNRVNETFDPENVNASQDALVTFQKGFLDITFDHQSALNILPGGVVEFNMNRGSAFDENGIEATGIIWRLYFDEGSILQVLRRGNGVGLLRMAPNWNFSNYFSDELSLSDENFLDFNNRSGVVIGSGHVQFKEFVLGNQVNTPLYGTFNGAARGDTYQQGGVLFAGTVLNSSLAVNRIQLFERIRLTADTLLPAGTLIGAGSYISGAVTAVDQTLAADTVFSRGDVLANDSIIAAKTYPAGTLSYAIILSGVVGDITNNVYTYEQYGTVIPAGTTIALGSERVNTTLRVQLNNFEFSSDGMVELFMRLAYIIDVGQLSRSPEDAVILVKKGSLIESEDGRLAAMAPPIRDGFNRDGRIVNLFEGDHDVKYEVSVGGTGLDTVVGTDFNETRFGIKLVDERLRTL